LALGPYLTCPGELGIVLSADFRLVRVFVLSVIVLCCTATAVAAAPDAAVEEVSDEDVVVRVPAAAGAAVANLAQGYVGSRYRWGGTSPAGFDCTGFVQFVYGQFGVSLPHDEAGQLAIGAPVGSDELEPGDVLVFANTYRRGLSHVGIYVGAGQFVHAADERHGVTVSDLWDGYWWPRLVGATRAVAQVNLSAISVYRVPSQASTNSLLTADG
jgi:cell wall-associated NlpC family hydrolase